MRYQVEDTIERKRTCDSRYMLNAMHCIAKAMRLKYHWVPLSTMLYLIIDNTVGHETDDCMDEYHMLLLKKYNSTIIQQVLQLPYTNIFDLGFWAGLQSAAKRKNYIQRINQEALV